MKKILLFGASGSIGKSTIKLVADNPDLFQIVGMSAHSRMAELVTGLIRLPQTPPILNTQEKSSLQDIKDFIEKCAPDIVLNAVSGFAGLNFSRATIESQIPLALANKESLVAAGDLLIPLAQKNNIPILPVDSEHSAIFQCLANDQIPIKYKPFEKLYLTCSGGPFRDLEDLSSITHAQALKHPNWDMGAKITIDSATLANKCLEFFEAMHLFGAKKDQIEIVIHPQSVVHSMVEFPDGSTLAQLSPPDMTLPIAVALNYPQKNHYKTPRQSFSHLDLSFRVPNKSLFRTLQVLDYCIDRMGSLPIVFNAVNEVAVEAFMKEQITFLDIFNLLEKMVYTSAFEVMESFEQIERIDKQARKDTLKLLNE